MANRPINIILTGATGMVGEGVLNECLHHPNVERVLIITRHQSRILHPKVEEIVHQNLSDLSSLSQQLSGYDACFFCVGTTSVGKSESEYSLVTYDLTVNFARSLLSILPQLTFCYISAKNADQTENGKTMWARIKGKTENKLLTLPFKEFYSFRPFLLMPTRNLSHTHTFYKFISWLFPMGRFFFPKDICTLRELGLAMIESAVAQNDFVHIIEVPEIVKLAHRSVAREVPNATRLL